ncbi:hypothetical protein [Wolbachia endosymbiont of Oedothorax gibbosus]|nr:hypothetical protein [Wolbachia endosymbiont of Oedothorax gibbosus]MDX5462140.1 hypothetical protein [Wolbachia endosymbiont of Tetragnatha montana]
MSEPIIGREKEVAILQDKLLSQSAEFIAVYAALCGSNKTIF